MLRGGKQLEARLEAIGKTETMLRRIQVRGVREAKLKVPRRTGNLGRTIRFGSVSATRCAIVAGGKLRVGYAGAVERGTKPHVIRAKRAKALAWGGQRTLAGGLRAGQKPDRFAKSVRHPGTKAKPFLVPGLREAAESEGITSLVETWNAAA